MNQPSGDGFHYGHEFYSKYIHEDENMKARLKAILNEIHEKRVAVKELHAEFGIKFSEVINSYQIRLEENSNKYESLVTDLVSRRERLLDICNKALTRQ